MAYRYHDSFKPARPREARGGIKAKSQRGGFGNSWWARRWLQVLEGFDLGARLSRGRSYARKGQVLSIDVDTGEVTARVQGSRARPYRVHVNVKTLEDSDWGKLSAALLERPVLAANLLAGRMPQDIEEVFNDAGLSLFPSQRADLETGCSCPDWSNPCKHVAAVYLLLGEEFDRDPFLVFRLRGLDRERLVSLIGGWTGSGGGEGPSQSDRDWVFIQELDHSDPVPLPLEQDEFWGHPDGMEDFAGIGSLPAVSAALPKRLGSFPFWKGQTAFMPAMEEIYHKASQAGLDVVLGGRHSPNRSHDAGGEG